MKRISVNRNSLCLEDLAAQSVVPVKHLPASPRRQSKPKIPEAPPIKRKSDKQRDSNSGRSKPFKPPKAPKVVSSFLSAQKRFESKVVENQDSVVHRPPKNIFQTPLHTPSNYKPPVFPKTEKEEKSIRNALDKRFVFQNLPERTLQSLIDAFEKKHVPAGKEVVRQGEVDDFFYVVQDGECAFQKDGEKAGVANAGESFGEDAMLISSPREASVVTTTDTNLFQVDQATFRHLLERETEESDCHKRALLEKVDFLQGASPESLQKLVALMKPKKFKKGETVVRKEDFGKAFHIIDEGEVQLRDMQVGRAPKENLTVGPGQCFGEQAIVGDGNAVKANVVALTAGKAYTIDRAEYNTAVGTASTLMPIEGRTVHSVTALMRDENPLNEKEIMKISRRIKDHVYAPGEIIIEENVETEAAIYFLRLGKVHSEKSRVLLMLTEGTHFGEDIFLAAKEAHQTTGIPAYRVTAKTECVCGVLSIKDYYKVFKEKVQESAAKPKVTKSPKSQAKPDVREQAKPDVRQQAKPIVKKHAKHEVKQQAKHEVKEQAKHEVKVGKAPLVAELSSELSLDDEVDKKPLCDIKLENLVRRVVLGEGNFGQVWLSVDKTAKEPYPYVLKIQSKFHLITGGEAHVCIREKEVLLDVDHTFIIKLFCTYQDNDMVYMLLDFVQGGELFSVLNPLDLIDRVSLDEDQAKFYTLAIADALAYLHGKKYVYRDIKPENILIDSLGYPKIIDFGFAKMVTDKTYTLCGTPGYLAPEVVLNRGHNWATDHWSLGILIHEMLSGESPFFEEGIEQMELFRGIVEDDFPRIDGISPQAADLLEGLLRKDPTFRYGSLARGERDILHHSWFSNLSLKALQRRQVKAPWKPDVKDPFDTSNFDDWSFLEDNTKQRYPKLNPKQAAMFENF